MALFTHESLNRNFGNVCLGSGILAIKAASNADAKTTAAIPFAVAGKLYSLAATATLDLSTATYATGGSLVLAVGETADLFCMVDAAGALTYYLVRDDEIWEPLDTVATFGQITITNGSASAFTVGTTPLDTALVTTVYSNLMVYPGFPGRSTSQGTTTF